VIEAWLRAFVLTQLVEAPVYRAAMPAKWRHALAASTLTHPFVWFLFPWLAERLDLEWITMAILAELFAWSAEALYFARVVRVRWWRAALVSLAANGASVAVGLFVRWKWGLV
jgi:hypothetical protein